MAEFMVLIRGGDDLYGAMSPEEVQAAVQQYVDWTDKLRNEGRFVASSKLQSGGETAELHRRAGNIPQARECYERALSLTVNETERRFLKRKLSECRQDSNTGDS